MTQTEKHSVSILLTAGLLAVVLIHAIALSTAQRAIPRIENAIFGESLTDNYPRGGINFDAQRMSDRPINALPINQSARDEIKRQTSGTPFTGTMNGVTYVNGKPCDTCPQPRQPQPTPKPTASTPISKPVAPKYSLSLFVLPGDRTSQQLTDWFRTDARLKQLASDCNFQIYTRDNPLYKARFASMVPPEAFPAVLFQDPNGGHVHAANGSSVTASASQLSEDLDAAYRLQKQIVTTLPGGPSPIQSAGDLSSSPSNSGPNCPDGNCPDQEQRPFWRRPGGGNDGGGLFPNLQPSTDPMQGILRMIFRPGETIFQVVIVMAAVITIVYFVKRGRS